MTTKNNCREINSVLSENKTRLHLIVSEWIQLNMHIGSPIPQKVREGKYIIPNSN